MALEEKPKKRSYNIETIMHYGVSFFFAKNEEMYFLIF